MDFTAFDFRDDFNLHEIASLCIGRDPALAAPFDNDPAKTAYREIISAAAASAVMASAECARAHFDGRGYPSLYPELLYPAWALERTPNADGEPAWTEVGKDRWPEEGFDPPDKTEWKFDRRTVASWLSSRAFKPSYDFSRRGGVVLRADDDSLTKPHARAEATYLTIIGALLELVRTPRPGRDSDAAVIRELIENYSDKPGISKTTLEAKFAEARRRLNST
ncbi:MAG: hypothetical protein QFE16_02665 [Pseudomonadota bacterium]|nr:hypothetical protein [Pseudomonadota bacterium]